MSVPIAALLAAAIYQTHESESDPAALENVLSLLARACEGHPITIASIPEGIQINGTLIPGAAPGVAEISKAFAAHDTAQLQLPGGLESKHWRLVAEVLGAPEGQYGTAALMLAALRASLPLAEIWSKKHSNPLPVRAPLVPDSAAAERAASDAGLTSRAAGLGSFSNQLSQLYTKGTEAASHGNVEVTTDVLLEFQTLERAADPAQIVVIARERRRMVTPEVLEWLLRMSAKPGTGASLYRAIASLGPDTMTDVLEVIGRTVLPREREAMSEIFSHVASAGSVVVHALRGGSTFSTIGAAEVAGRRQITEAVAALGPLLRSDDADVRTAAWRALEAIGTREAVEALSSKGR